MSSDQQPLRISNFQQGMGDSPYVGNGVIRNADIDSFIGGVKVSKKPRTFFHDINTVTFTADAGTDICTASGTIEANGINFGGAAVYFTTTGTLPAGLSADTTYYLIYVSGTTFKVATSYANAIGSSAGTNIDITDTGTGTHTMQIVPIGTVNYIIEEPGFEIKFFLSDNGRVWFSTGSRAYLINNAAIDTPSSGVANASGEGLVVSSFTSTSNSWLFVFRNGTIDVINVAGVSTIEALGWNNAWQSLNTSTGVSNSHHAIRAQDDAIYFCDDRYVGSIIENTGSTFDPTSGATYTYTNQALDLPTHEIAQCLEEYDSKLLVGGDTFDKIYPWDRTSNSFDIPITVPETAIKRMKNIGGILYILAGTWGNIYTSQGVYAKLFRTLPRYVVNNSYSIQSNPITWGGIAAVNGSLIFGVAGQTSGSSGVYRLYPDGRLIHDNTPSTGSANVIGLFAENEFYIMGYNGGADNFGGTEQYDSGLATIVESGLEVVGTKTHKAAYSELEVILGKPGVSGSIEISYREDTSSSFTTIDTFALTGGNTETRFKTDAGLIDIESIQIRASMHGDPELMEVILYP